MRSSDGLMAVGKGCGGEQMPVMDRGVSRNVSSENNKEIAAQFGKSPNDF